VLLVAAAVWEGFTKRSPIIPPRLFRTRTTALLLVSVFLHAFIFFAGMLVDIYSPLF
jgi:hypothetical protein